MSIRKGGKKKSKERTVYADLTDLALVVRTERMLFTLPLLTTYAHQAR